MSDPTSHEASQRLTERQREVWGLLRQGLTNEEIAQRLGVTLDGAKWHVSEILRRLNVSSREEAAAWPGRRRRWLALPFGGTGGPNLTLAAQVGGAALIAGAAVAVAVMLWAVLRTTSSVGGSPPTTLQERIQHNDLIAYTVVAREYFIPGGLEPIRQAVWTVGVFDPTERRTLSTFEVGGNGENMRQAVPAGDEIVINMSTGVFAYKSDGSERRLVRASASSGSLMSIATSRDGEMLAIVESVPPSCDERDAGCIVIAQSIALTVVDIDSGDEIMRVIRPWPIEPLALIGDLTWREDGEGLVVRGFGFGEHRTAFTTVMLDGSMTRHAATPSRFMSLTGQLWASAGRGACLTDGPSSAPHVMVIRDAMSEKEVARVTHEESHIEPVAWSRDGRSLMYKTFPSPPDPTRPGCATNDTANARWHSLDVDSGQVVEADSRFAIEQRWYEDAAIEFRCDGQPVEEPFCPGQGGDRPVDAYAAGVKFASGKDFRLITTPQRMFGQ